MAIATTRVALLMAGLALFVAPARAQLVNIDLCDWVDESPPANGIWTVRNAGGSTANCGSEVGESVFQSINGEPTFFVSPVGDTYLNTTLDGTFTVQTTSDDDYIGFVFGYQGPVGNPSDPWDFFLFAWKQLAQNDDSPGFYLIKIDAADQPPFGTYAEDLPASGRRLIATNFGLGWADNTEYQFTLDYSSDAISIRINGSLVIDVDRTVDEAADGTDLAALFPTGFPEGRFGFYNHSQASVLYSGFTSNNDPVAEDDNAVAYQQQPTAIDVLANDSDADPGQAITITQLVSGPANGNATIDDNGTPGNPSDDFITYTSTGTFAGTDTFVYEIEDSEGGTDQATVTVTVGPDCAAPGMDIVWDGSVEPGNYLEILTPRGAQRIEFYNMSNLDVVGLFDGVGGNDLVAAGTYDLYTTGCVGGDPCIGFEFVSPDAEDAEAAVYPQLQALSGTSVRFFLIANDGCSTIDLDPVLSLAVDPDAAPAAYRLDGNYPNPFNPRTTIHFSLPEAQHVRLTVHDVAGREVAVLADGVRTAGRHTVAFEAASLPSGVYLYRLEAGPFSEVRRMTLLK